MGFGESASFGGEYSDEARIGIALMAQNIVNPARAKHAMSVKEEGGSVHDWKLGDRVDLVKG